MTIEWEARRAGADKDIILCGRTVAGRYVCNGEIAYFMDQWTGEPPVPVASIGLFFPAGLVEGPAGFWGESTRFKPRHPRWRRAGAATDGPAGMAWTRLDDRLPARRRCPHCRTIAIVSSGVLG